MASNARLPGVAQDKPVPYRPVAEFADSTTWEDMPKARIIPDPFESAISVIGKIRKALGEGRDTLEAAIGALRVHLSSPTRRASLAEVTNALGVLIDVLEKEHKEIKQDRSQPTISAVLSTLAHIPFQKRKLSMEIFRDFRPQDEASQHTYAYLIGRHGHLDKILTGLHDAIGWTTFSPNGDVVFCGSSSGVETWDCERKTVINRIPFEEHAEITDISPDGSQFAVAFEEFVDLRDLLTGQVLYHLEGPAGQVLSYSPNRDYIASASWDGSIQVWHVADATPSCARIEGRGHDEAVCELAFSSDGSKLLGGCADSTVRIWDIGGGHQGMPKVLRGHEGPVYAVAFSKDNTVILSGSADGTLRLWDTTTEEGSVLGGGLGTIVAAVFSPDGKLVASACINGTIHVWNLSETPNTATKIDDGLLDYKTGTYPRNSEPTTYIKACLALGCSSIPPYRQAPQRDRSPHILDIDHNTVMSNSSPAKVDFYDHFHTVNVPSLSRSNPYQQLPTDEKRPPSYSHDEFVEQHEHDSEHRCRHQRKCHGARLRRILLPVILAFTLLIGIITMHAVCFSNGGMVNSWGADGGVIGVWRGVASDGVPDVEPSAENLNKRIVDFSKLHIGTVTSVDDLAKRVATSPITKRQSGGAAPGNGSNEESAFTRNKLYLIVIFVGLLVVIILAIMLSAWCCKSTLLSDLAEDFWKLTLCPQVRLKIHCAVLATSARAVVVLHVSSVLAAVSVAKVLANSPSERGPHMDKRRFEDKPVFY
ncbi:hypothetical protein EYR38_006184 [Pleurotus pulmonarius]|nr:hypothetical protein EYR38_006184 [Pleurotus pulmonarius]